MAKCLVRFPIATGAGGDLDVRNGAVFSITPAESYDNGTYYVTADSKSYHFTNPPAQIEHDQGQAYRYHFPGSSEPTTYRLVPNVAGPVDFQDLEIVDYVPPTPGGILGDELITGLLENPASDFRAAVEDVFNASTPGSTADSATAANLGAGPLSKAALGNQIATTGTPAEVAITAKIGTVTPGLVSGAGATRNAVDARVTALAAPKHVGLIGAAFAGQATNPVVNAHRCSRNLFPEETRRAADATLALGIPSLLLDIDVWGAADGTLVVTHDQTLDLKTTGTGDIQAQTLPSASALTVDAGTWFAPAWGNLSLITFGEFLNLYGGKVGISIEAHGSSWVLPAIISQIQQAGLTGDVLINSSVLSEIATIKAAGIHACYYFTTANQADSTNRAAVLAAAPNSLIVYGKPMGGVDADVTTINSWGIPWLLFTGDRRSSWTKYRAMGAAGVLTNDPAYTLGRSRAQTSDTWNLKTFGHGMITQDGTLWADNGDNALARPTFTGTRSIRVPAGANQRNVLIGEVALALAGPNRVFDFYLTCVTVPTTVTRYGGIAITDSDEEFQWANTANPHVGYTMQSRANGSLEANALVRNSGASLLGTAATTPAWTAGARRRLRLTLTATTVKFEDVTNAVSQTVSHNPAGYRPAAGWYVHLGKNDQSPGDGVWEFDTLTIT